MQKKTLVFNDIILNALNASNFSDLAAVLK